MLYRIWETIKNQKVFRMKDDELHLEETTVFNYVNENDVSLMINNNTDHSIVTFLENNIPIVSLERDGTVNWPNGIHIDKAARAFGSVLQYGFTESCGVTADARHIIQNSILDDLILLAEENGSLTI